MVLLNNAKDSHENRLKELLGTLSTIQLRYVVARVDKKSDQKAADDVGISLSTVAHWENKKDVDETVSLMHLDGVLTALEIRRRALPLAMKVKLEGLEYNDKNIKQRVATELVEWELGKPTQPSKVEGSISLAISGLTEALEKVYGSDGSRNNDPDSA
jgi:transcriptional regulator with XRE-family HTH domain